MPIEYEIDRLIPIIKKYLGNEGETVIFRNNRNLTIVRNLFSSKTLDITIFDIRDISNIYDDINKKNYVSIWTDRSSHISIWEDGDIIAAIN